MLMKNISHVLWKYNILEPFFSELPRSGRNQEKIRTEAMSRVKFSSRLGFQGVYNDYILKLNTTLGSRTGCGAKQGNTVS